MQSEHAKVIRGGKLVRSTHKHHSEQMCRALCRTRSQHTAETQESELPARELVPGDVVELRVGDKVSSPASHHRRLCPCPMCLPPLADGRRLFPQIPADMRLVKLKTATLKIEQASLTGEAVSVMKRLEPNPDMGCELQA